MSKVKRWKNFIVLVDAASPPQFRHKSAGRYRVGARTEKEAKQLVQNAVKFGSVNVYYEDKNLSANYGDVFREIYDDITKQYTLQPVIAN